MQVKYCSKSGCGGKTEYTSKPPAFCSKCGFEFAKAFAQVSTPQRVTVAAAPEVKKVIRRHSKPIEMIDDEDVVDKDQMMQQAQELAASIRGDIIVRPQTTFGIKLGDLLKNPDQFSDVGVRTYSAPTPEE